MIENSNFLKRIAANIPARIRKAIVDEMLIEKAINAEVINTPMHFLFDVHAEFIEPGGDNSLWSCYKCREKVLQDFRKLKDSIVELNNESQT